MLLANDIQYGCIGKNHFDYYQYLAVCLCVWYHLTEAGNEGEVYLLFQCESGGIVLDSLLCVHRSLVKDLNKPASL